MLPLTVMDVQGEKNTRIYVLDDFLSGVNTLGIEGRLPAAYGECSPRGTATIPNSFPSATR